MAKIADRLTFKSTDARRVATYEPAGTPPGTVPPGLEHYRKPIYRLLRTVRTRRGFGTIIHTLTTFTTNKAQAHKSAAHWVKIRTKER
jgi:hypothetical protein